MKKVLAVLLVSVGLSSLTSCNQRDFKILKDYVIEMPTYTTIDYQYASEWFKVNPFGAGGCSAITKDIGTTAEPHLIVGRNMDYGFSDKCAYVIRTNEPGGYKTLGIAYATAKASPSFSSVKSHGISDEWRKMAPFFCTDIINEHGLYCEIDMRNVEKDEDGKSIFHCEGTKKGAEFDVHMVAVTRFIVNHCKTVEEAENYVKNNINVFNNENDWNFSFLLADATGAHAVLEFGHDQIAFDKEKFCQTNFFINDPFGPKGKTDGESKNHFGIGRYDYLTKNIDGVTDATKMFNLMDNVSYSNVYKGYQCPFAMRSEAYGLVTLDGEDQSFKTFMSDEKSDEVWQKIGQLMAYLNSLPDKEKKKLPWYWQSTFTNVIDIPSKTIYTRMFENPDYTFTFTL
ncbi:MAG: carcinine hydrolase/isopenicillin-N N-acyltransferase family protein [Bacilli bacterium]|nr:carcinine hydrolase/isopenicillin-N N-acyltransferase family protein [Bacilli bacterium]